MGVRSRHEPARAGEGRRGPERAGQISETGQIVDIRKSGQRRGGMLGAGNQVRLNTRCPPPVKVL